MIGTMLSSKVGIRKELLEAGVVVKIAYRRVAFQDEGGNANREYS